MFVAAIIQSLVLLVGPKVEPGLTRQYLTFDKGGVVYIETYAPNSLQLKAGIRAASVGDWSGAERIFATLVKADPKNLAAREAEAESAIHLGHAEALRNRLAAAIHKDPADWRSMYEFGVLDLPTATEGLGLNRRGSHNLGQAYFIKPDAWPVALAYSDMCLGLRQVDGARQALRRIINENPSRRDFLPSLARALMFGSIGSATYDRTTKKWVADPPNPDRRPQREQAMQILQSLMQSAPNCPTVYYLAGGDAEFTGDYVAADKYYNRYLAFHENSPTRANWVQQMPVRKKLAEMRKASLKKGG